MFFIKHGKFRSTIILLLLLAVTVTANAQEGQITLRKSRVVAGEVIRAIENQTGYRVAYNRNVLDTMRTLNLPDTRLSVKDALDNIVGEMELKYIVRNQYIAFVPDNKKPRPQALKTTKRTSDEYIRNDMNALDASPQPRPESVVELVAPTIVKIVEEPEPFQYSDYNPIDIYGDIQKSLPRFAVKVNMLYGAATLTPNISAEVALSKRSTIELSYSSNPWKYKADLADNKKFLHGIARAEYRYWFCERYNGHFLGVHGLYSEYNISGHKVPLLFEKDYRYKGSAYGGGITYGYNLPIGKQWNLEFAAGLGLVYMDYDRYSCRTCDTDSQSFKKTYFGPTRAAISIVFLIK